MSKPKRMILVTQLACLKRLDDACELHEIYQDVSVVVYEAQLRGTKKTDDRVYAIGRDLLTAFGGCIGNRHDFRYHEAQQRKAA